ncbi:MAG: hypothetical protein K2K75_06190 [Muribaculaceae bacterium]|nr:hypothetical protein [Muribaculaceae bacterium]
MKYSFSKVKTDRNYNEDFKTYATLGVLQYLPSQVFWNILRASVIDNHKLPKSSGEIELIDFWPKWYKLQNIEVVNNKKYIEPDVFIRFEKFDCIVEVKKTDTLGQHVTQWESQTQAYKNEYPEGKRLVYIALGGNPNLEALSLDKFSHVYKSTWLRLLREVDKALQERISFSYKTEATYQEYRILKSTLDAFACYDEYVVEFMETMDRYKHSIKLPTKETLTQLWKI